VPVDALSDTASAESSGVVRDRVAGARAVQQERNSEAAARVNALLHGPAIARYCRPDGRGAARLARAVDVFGLSARGYHRVLKVARTIADIEGATGVGDVHIAEALQFRGT
jgi:magnesium chelatase family protein